MNTTKERKLRAASRQEKHTQFPVSVEPVPTQDELREYRKATKTSKANPRFLRTIKRISNGVVEAIPVPRAILFKKGYQTEPHKRQRVQTNGKSILTPAVPETVETPKESVYRPIDASKLTALLKTTTDTAS